MSFNRTASRSYLVLIFIMVTLTVILTGCTPDEMFPSSPDGDGSSSNQGGDGIVLHLPFPTGVEKQCTQGAHGTFSHSSDSTKFDIDLDTSNSVNEEIYAPIGGIAYVHMNSATSGFGYHVNIDVGGGKYAVIGHFSDIFVANGQQVSVGQLIGYEGCTGNCSGDHVHVGLHEGSAAQDAAQGVSIEVSYLAADATNYGTPQTISSKDFVCGLVSEGDPVQGHFYESALPVPMWHPNGTLVKTPGNARVYTLEDGQLRWIQDENVFWSLNYDFDQLTLVSDEELDCYGQTAAFDGETRIDAAEDQSGQRWLVVGNDGDSDQYRQRVQEIGWQEVLASWGLGYTYSNPPPTRSSLTGSVVDGYAGLRSGTLVTEASSSDVYAISGDDALPIFSWDVYLMMGFAQRTVMTVDDGLVRQLHTLGSCSADVGCIDQDAVTTCGGGLDLGSGNVGGPSDGDDDDTTDVQDDPVDDEEEEEDVPDEEDPIDDEEEEAAVGTTCEQDACILDVDGDGMPETLAMADDLWLTTALNGMPAFVYSYGACFDGVLSLSDLMYTSDGYYQIDFSGFWGDCVSDLSLVSSMGTDGGAPTSTMSNWYWWQGAGFCSGGSNLCDLQDNGTSWEEWLISVSWDPTTGLESAGNGFTSNSQL